MVSTLNKLKRFSSLTTHKNPLRVKKKKNPKLLKLIVLSTIYRYFYFTETASDLLFSSQYNSKMQLKFRDSELYLYCLKCPHH